MEVPLGKDPPDSAWATGLQLLHAFFAVQQVNKLILAPLIRWHSNKKIFNWMSNFDTQWLPETTVQFKIQPKPAVRIKFLSCNFEISAGRIT